MAGFVQDENSPLVSVIIPCYNTEKYVEQAVRSIMEQTYTNLEILCCDDCSTDGTFAILQKLAAEDSRVKLFKNETNQKIVKTLNFLVSESSGEYIARMDADDISLPERLEKQVLFLQKNLNVGFCGCNAFHINEADKIIGKSHLPKSSDDTKLFLPYYSTFYHPTVMACAKIFKQNLYNENFLYAEDYELWCRLIFEKGIRGANLGEYLFKYRINRQGISRKNAERQVCATVRAIDKYVVMPVEESEFHKNIFFLHEHPVEKKEIRLLKTVKLKLSKNEKSLSFSAYIKLLFHLKKFHQWKLFLSAALCPLGVYSLKNICLESGKR